MKKIIFTAIAIVVAIFAVPAITVFAEDTELIVEYSADKNSVKLNWYTNGKNVIDKSTVYKYNAETKSFLKTARTDTPEYTDNDVLLNAGESVIYKIIATLKRGGKVSKTVTCYTELSDIPSPFPDLMEGEACRAYVYDNEVNEKGMRPIIYHNCFGDKIIGETVRNKGVEEFSASENGKVVFYSTDTDVYRYCDNKGKAELIFRGDEIKYIITSSNGDCCAFLNTSENGEAVLVWYEGKIFSCMPKEDEPYHIEAVFDDGRVVYSAAYDNDDEEIYRYCLYEFNSKTAKNKRFANLKCSESYIYWTEIFPEEGTYTMCNDDFGYYCGEIGSKPKLLLSADECVTDFAASNGKISVTYNEKYIYAIDHESGKKSVITEIAENTDLDKIYEYFKCSSDLSAAVYIDNENNLIVRFSEWDAKSCKYTKRQEIKFDVSDDMRIGYTSNNLNIINFYGEKNDFIAFFQNGSIKPAGKILGIDVYDRMFCYESVEKVNTYYYRYKNLMILEPDGSTTVVYNGYFYTPQFASSEMMRIYFTEYLLDEDYNVYYSASSDVYFIDKNGKAVFGWYEEYEHVITP